MTSSVEAPSAPQTPPQAEQEQLVAPSMSADQQRAILAHKFGRYAGAMSDEVIDKWFGALDAKTIQELVDEFENSESSTPEKAEKPAKIQPKPVTEVLSIKELTEYQKAMKGNIEEARKAYAAAFERRNRDRGRVTVVGRMNNAYIMGVLKRADARAAKDEKYAKKRQRRHGEDAEAYAKRLKWYDRRSRAAVALGVATGAALYLGTRAHAFDFVHDQIMGGGANHHEAINLVDAHEQVGPDQQHIDMFKYDHNIDPFYQPGKEGIHDFGAPLHPDTADGTKPAGWTDWTNTRMVHSPEQLASIATGMGIDGQSDSNMNQLAEQFKDGKGGPQLMSHYHDEVMKILNDKNTKIHEEKITGPYASLYEWDQNGDGVLARDDYVNKPDANGSYGTKIVIEFTDAAGHRQVMEIRKECGGQRIWACVVPIQEVSYSAPQSSPEYTTVAYTQPDAPVSHPKPQGTGTPPHHDTPPAPQPPVEQPPAPQPPAPQPPVVHPPAPKPPEHKGNEYPSNGFVKPTGPGNFMQTPAQVETQHQTQPERNAGVPQGSILDNILKAPGAETGGQKRNGTPGLNTGGNAGGNKIGTPEVGKPTNSGKVGSSL